MAKKKAKTPARKAKKSASHRAKSAAKRASKPKVGKAAKRVQKQKRPKPKPKPKPKAKAKKAEPGPKVKARGQTKEKAKTGAKGKGRAEGSKKGASSQVGAQLRRTDGWLGPMPDKAVPRSTKLPSEGAALTKREMEQVLTVGIRGVAGEGGLKGRVVVYQNLPYLEVIGRDKRELWFLLQGPDQEVFPAYADHKVSVSGLIRRFHPNGGSVDVRKYTARKPDEAVEAEGPAVEDGSKLRLLSPGEVETLASPGMAVGLKGFATLRGRLELSGEEFFLVVSNAGTRQQVAFTIEGRATKGIKKYVGEVAVATGVVEKQTGWGGRIDAEVCEPRAPEFPPVARGALEIVDLDVSPTTISPKDLEVKVNHGLVIRLAEKQGHVWAVEPQIAKRVSLREVALHSGGGSTIREFFFTPRNPGLHEVEFFLGRLHNPMQVSRTFKVMVNVKGLDDLVEAHPPT